MNIISESFPHIKFYRVGPIDEIPYEWAKLRNFEYIEYSQLKGTIKSG